MIDVSSIINDPDFNVPFTRIQVAGAFSSDPANPGVWTMVEAPVESLNGIILPSKLDELKVLPEGERSAAAISIYSLTPLNLGDQQATEPDIIGYLGGFYRIAYVRFYLQCALYYAIATRYQRAP